MKIRIYLKSFSKDAINEAIKTILFQLSSLENKTISSVALPTKIKKFCVLKSPHVDKDSREQFEIRIFKRFIDITINKVEDLIPLFENFIFPEGVACFFGILEK